MAKSPLKATAVGGGAGRVVVLFGLEVVDVDVLLDGDVVLDVDADVDVDVNVVLDVDVDVDVDVLDGAVGVDVDVLDGAVGVGRPDALEGTLAGVVGAG